MTEPAGSTDAVERKSLWLLGCMWVAYVLNYCDRQVVSAQVPVLKTALDLTDEQLGLAGSVFLWVYGLTCPLAGQFGDKVSKRLLVVLSLVVWSLFTVGTGLSTSLVMLLTMRAAMGLSEAMYMPAAISLTAGAFSVTHRSRVLATLATAQIVGTIAGSWFGGWMGGQGLWREAFFALGAIGVLFAIPSGLFLRTVNESTKVETKAAGAEWAALVLMKIPSFALLCVAYSAFTFGLWLINYWLPTLLKEKFDLGLADANLNATVFLQISTLVGMLCSGAVADRLYVRTKAARMWLLACSLLGGTPFIYLLGSCDTLAVTRLALLGVGFFAGVFIGNANSAAFEIVPGDGRASAVGVLNLFGAVIAGCGVLFGGVWKKSLGMYGLLSLTAGIYLLAGLLLACAIHWLFQRDYARVH